MSCAQFDGISSRFRTSPPICRPAVLIGKENDAIGLVGRLGTNFASPTIDTRATLDGRLVDWLPEIGLEGKRFESFWLHWRLRLA